MRWVIRGGDWKSLEPIARELLESPELDKIELRDYDPELSLYVFDYKGYHIQVYKGLRVADSDSLNPGALLVVRDKRVGKLKRKLKKLLREVV